jgi:hypothetical protein
MELNLRGRRAATGVKAKRLKQGANGAMPDPDQVTSADWANIHNWLTLLWIYFPVVIGFAFTMLIAHAWIPSMVMTGQLPPIANRARIPLTLLALVALVLAAILMASVVILTPQALSLIWERLLV